MFAEDRSLFFDPGVFGTASTFNGATAVNVIYGAEHFDALGVSSSNPAALGDVDDFPDQSCVGKTLQIGADVWTIRDRQPIDDGAIVLLQLGK